MRPGSGGWPERRLVAWPTRPWSQVPPGDRVAGVRRRELVPARRSPPSDGATPFGIHPGDVAVVDRASFHPSPTDRADRLRALARDGVPVVAEGVEGRVEGGVEDEVARRLGEGLAALVGRLSVRDLADGELVGRVVAEGMRRAGEEGQRRAGEEGQPSVTAVVATRRPGRLAALASTLAAQVEGCGGDLQVVVALHGRGFGERAASVLRRAVPDAVVLACDGRQPLGSVLASATARADGDLVAKLDDDDVYAPWHLHDLAVHQRIRGAEVVGRAAELVHLARLGVTVRRRFEVTCGWVDAAAGGAMAVRRDVLAEVGGWPPVHRHVDQAVLRRLRAGRARVFRAPPFGYLLVRHEDHTWAAEDRWFLDEAVGHWRGRADAVAGVGATAASSRRDCGPPAARPPAAAPPPPL